MKKFGVFALLAALSLFCGKKSATVKLTSGTPAYVLGQELAPVVPFMNPDSNKILATSKSFDVSAGEVLQYMVNNFGNRTSELKSMEAGQVEGFLKQITTQLVEKRLLLNAAKKAGTKVASASIDSFLTAQYEQAGGEQAFIDHLKEIGIGIDFVKTDVRENRLIGDHLNQVAKERSEVTQEQIQEAYQKYVQDTTVSVRHILLMTQDKSEAEKRRIHKKMEGILSRARANEDFAALATEYTEDPGSKENGGLYEHFNRGTMVKPFEDASFSVPVGEISDIVETRYGYHIIKVIERGPGTKSLDEMKPQLESQLREPNWQNVIQTYIQELKEKAKVELKV